MYVSGSFLSLQFVDNLFAAFFTCECSITLALVGQVLTQAQQRMQASCSVMTNLSMMIAALGHTSTHFPHLIHCSSLVMGDIASELARAAELNFK
jgi:hypothetical protein